MSDALGPLRSPAFRSLVAARVVTVLGSAVAPVALAFAMLELTGGDATALGVVVGARSLSNVVFLLVGGVVADRVPRQLLLVGSSLAAAATQGLVAGLVLTGTDSIVLLAGLSALNGAVAAFSLPAAAALQPQTVARHQLQQANALARIGVSGAMVLGASLGGVLVALVGPGWGIALDAVSFGLAGVLFSRVRVPAGATTQSAGAERLWTGLRLGWQEFTGRTWLWVVVVAFLVVNAVVAGSTGVLGPLVARDTIGVAGWGFVLTAQAAGYIVGGVVALRLRVRRLLRFGTACVAGESLVLLALGLLPSRAVLVAAGFAAGFAIEQFGVAWETSMQQHVPADRLARVYSYDMLGSFLAIPLGEVLAAPVAAVFGPTRTLVGAAAVVLTATAAALASRSVRDLPNAAAPANAAREAPAPA